MRPTTNSVLENMLARAEETMLQEDWNQFDISVFMSDPVFRLLYGACADEITRTREEIYHVEQRLIRKTIEQFLPEEFFAPSPAHAIFCARPVDKLNECNLGHDFQISLYKSDRQKTEFIYTPAVQYTLVQADIDYIVFGNKMYSFEGGKKMLLPAESNPPVSQQDIFWLGIRNLNKLLPRERLSLFFNIPASGAELAGFLNALRFLNCSAYGKPVRHVKGLSGYDRDLHENMLKRPDYMVFKEFQRIMQWYERHYLTLFNLPLPPSDGPAFPPGFNPLFPLKTLEKIGNDVYWLSFSFTNLLKESWIHSLFCSLNCFPALNLKIEQAQFDTENMPINIFPVTSDHFIYSVHSVTGKERNKPEESSYRLLSASIRETVGREGEAIFKRGGLRRLEPDKLKAMLNHLSNLLKEETILLTKDGNKEDLDRLNRLTRAVTDFEKSIETGKNSLGRYTGSVIIKPARLHNRIFIRFWTTAGEDANQVMPQTGSEGAKQCELSYGPDVKADSLTLVTITTGGKQQPTEEEHTDTLRKLLLTRGRIVTAEDVKAFCYEHFSPRKINVDVRKSYIQSTNPGQGIQQVVDVLINLGEKSTINPNELATLKEELLQKLEQNSANVMPFRVTINL